ncbi:hypothetical protein QQP08_006842 [Theobroma cacao]|nr:hypothetical protein QQP08_006842 [Theobroma cacao]
MPAELNQLEYSGRLKSIFSMDMESPSPGFSFRLEFLAFYVCSVILSNVLVNSRHTEAAKQDSDSQVVFHIKVVNFRKLGSSQSKQQ